MPDELVAQMRAVCREFFDLPLEEKLKSLVSAGSYVGYSPLEAESLSNTIDEGPAADLKESFTCSPVHVTDDPYFTTPDAQGYFVPTPWPNVPAGFRAVWEEYYTAMSKLSGGLEIQAADGTWQAVPVVPGTFIVNLGDLMAQWTNDTWVSTKHRVVTPPSGVGDITERLSLVFFHQPNYDAVIEPISTCVSADRPPRYASTTSGRHLLDKVAKQQLADDS